MGRNFEKEWTDQVKRTQYQEASSALARFIRLMTALKKDRSVKELSDSRDKDRKKFWWDR